MPAGRIPAEPTKAESAASEKFVVEGGPVGGTDGEELPVLALPPLLDFRQLKTAFATANSDDYRHAVENYAAIVRDAGLRLTDPIETSMAHYKTVESSSPAPACTIVAERAEVAGSQDPDLLAVRHTAHLDVGAATFFDMYVKLNYTHAVDTFTYLVESVEKIDLLADDDSPFGWMQVVYTADRILPFFAVRDFLTLDFCDEANLLLCSRSCLHPDHEITKPPSMCSGCCCRGRSNQSRRTYRSPLVYFLRVIPEGESKCRVVQFQYSDVGGVIPPARQSEEVVKFGFENLPKLAEMAKKCAAKHLDVGNKGSANYAEDPLVPEWRQDPSEMIEGL